jgi:hypothetical protein
MSLKPNQAYFERLKGPWQFTAHFEVLSWMGLFQSDTTLVNKLRLTAFVLSQALMGSYKMDTLVEVEPGSDRIKHTTLIRKFGLEILRSEKNFHLDPNGYDLSLEGAEFYWPMTKTPMPFQIMKGRVEKNATRAQYQMPLVGLATECHTIMEAPQAFIKIETPWFQGAFSFTQNSMSELNSRKAPLS